MPFFYTGNRAHLATRNDDIHVPLDDVARDALAELEYNASWTAPNYVCIVP